MRKLKLRSYDCWVDRWSLRIACFLTVLACLLIAPCSSQGQDDLPDITPCAGADGLTRLEHDGQAGMWFQMDTARCMLGRIAALPRYSQRLELQGERIRILLSTDNLQRRRYEVSVESEQRAVDALEAAVRGQRHAEKDLNAWHRSRILWFIVGAIVMAGVVALTAYVMDRLE